LATGGVRCWGLNDRGQLGDGTTVSRSNPVVVAGIENVVSISTKGTYACVVIADGRVRCWGDNLKGRSSLMPSPIEEF